MKISVSTKIKTRIIHAASGRVAKERPWVKNLVMDAGLNSLAQKAAGLGGSFPCSVFTFCKIGGGTNANSFASGAITFTQSTNTVTASAPFFTAAMVNGILKYGASGSGGAEQYITAFTDSTHVTVSSSATVTPTAGTVWMVQQTALQTFLFDSQTYRTLAGDNSSVFTGSTVAMQRTFTFPLQGSPYSVNEIGYSNIAGNSIAGRVVLPSTDVVGTSFFYQVVIVITYTFTPNAPAASANVGTNINVAGNIMVECWDIFAVQASGGNASNLGSINTALDGVIQSINMGCKFATATYTQNATIQNSAYTAPTTFDTTATASAWVYTPGSVGVSTVTFTINVTSTGQTVFGLFLTCAHNALDVKFTASQTLPNGSFQGSVVWQRTYGRTLVN